MDAFLFNDEIDLASLRIKFLKPHIDRFYVGESTQTFSGNKKPLNFSKILRDKPYFNEIVEVIVIPELSIKGLAENRWLVEEYQRDYFLRAVVSKLAADDLIVFSDLDEIPSISQLLKSAGTDDLPRSLLMPCFYRRAHWKS